MIASSKARQATNKKRKTTEVIVIDDEEESASEQEPSPPPTPPTPEVVALQQKVAELEENYQSACRAIGEERVRAERAENLFESKRGILDGSLPTPEVVSLQQKVAKLEAKYKKVCLSAGEEKARAERAEAQLDCKIGILDETRRDLDNQLEQRLEELSKQLADARRNADEWRQKEFACASENDAVKVDLVRLRRSEEIANRKNSELARELDDSRRKAKEDRERIGDLRRRLSVYEVKKKQQQEPIQKKLQQVQKMQSVQDLLMKQLQQLQPVQKPLQQIQKLQSAQSQLMEQLQQPQPDAPESHAALPLTVRAAGAAMSSAAVQDWLSDLENSMMNTGATDLRQ